MTLHPCRLEEMKTTLESGERPPSPPCLRNQACPRRLQGMVQVLGMEQESYWQLCSSSNSRVQHIRVRVPTDDIWAWIRNLPQNWPYLHRDCLFIRLGTFCAGKYAIQRSTYDYFSRRILTSKLPFAARISLVIMERSRNQLPTLATSLRTEKGCDSAKDDGSSQNSSLSFPFFLGIHLGGRKRSFSWTSHGVDDGCGHLQYLYIPWLSIFRGRR